MSNFEGLIDMHVHTNFSIDSEAKLVDYIVRAEELGLKGICLTEHADYNPDDPHYDYFSYPDYAAAIDREQKKLLKSSSELKLLKGIEFSEAHLYQEKLSVLKNKDFDVIMAAVHTISGGLIGTEELMLNYSAREIMSRYYDSLLEMVRYGEFDVLAHFDFPRRYTGTGFYHEFAEEISAILTEVVKNEIVLEINTSPVRRFSLEPMPSRKILQEY
ncbi:MAG: PHP domain-containing protein, partial [Bacillota bacterium]